MHKYRALLLTLLLPQVAAAGPIEWGYRAEVTYAQDYGSRFTVTTAPAGTVTATPGEPGYAWLFNSTGVSRPEPGSFEVQYGFDITVTLTDVASGESAALVWGGGYSSLWYYQPDTDPNDWRWEYEVSDFGDNWDAREVTLGNTRYNVRAYGGGMGQFPNGELAVRAEALPVTQTPEPGTLALAGIGLAVALRRGRVLRV